MRPDRAIDTIAWLPEAGRIYSDNVVSSLAEQFNVAAPQIAAFARSLRFSGANYLDMKNADQNSAASNVNAHKLAEIRDLAIELRTGIDALNEPTADLLWHRDQAGGLMRFLVLGAVDQLGDAVRRVQLPSGGTGIFRLRETDMRASVQMISISANDAIERSPGRIVGRPPNDALNLWVANMRQIWFELLRREFTFSIVRGIGKGKAFKFCVAMMRPLDPTVDESKLLSGLQSDRKTVRSYNAVKSHKNHL